MKKEIIILLSIIIFGSLLNSCEEAVPKNGNCSQCDVNVWVHRPVLCKTYNGVTATDIKFYVYLTTPSEKREVKWSQSDPSGCAVFEDIECGTKFSIKYYVQCIYPNGEIHQCDYIKNECIPQKCEENYDMTNGDGDCD